MVRMVEMTEVLKGSALLEVENAFILFNIIALNFFLTMLGTKISLTSVKFTLSQVWYCNCSDLS